MPASITRLMIGTAMASAIAVVSTSQAGSAQSLTQLFSHEELTNRYQPPVSETDFLASQIRC
jgi:hypothetical protein